MRCGLLLALVAATAPSLRGQTVARFSGADWELRGTSRVDSNDGREVLRIRNGLAYRRDLRLEDGTIDVDVRVTSQRSFVYVGFRIQDDQNLEEFYLRPHKSQLPDAIQYAPVYQGQSAWQLYHGARGTAPIPVAAGTWQRLRIVLQGRRAAVFLGDTAKPVLVVPRLGREPRAGYVMLRGFLPANSPGEAPIAEYSGFRARPGYVPYDFGAVSPEAEPAPGVIRRWSVGPSFAAGDSAPRILPSPATVRQGTVLALADGLVELHRQVTLPGDLVVNGVSREAGVVAWVDLTARTAGRYRLDLGFSDAASVFLDGVPVFYKNDSYLFAERRDGLIGFDQATLYLPLKAGINRLAVLVTDHFGGWGLMGRIETGTGVTVSSDP